ncbi:unnamed protein product [Linum tenue]|uniref:Uncharacterized protein n=1 Tax=Linum tenue TaxID=586396 RepID=A0AAV0QMR0_9ROSI|nr:unnamed protein product [Linum tenue]
MNEPHHSVIAYCLSSDDQLLQPGFCSSTRAVSGPLQAIDVSVGGRLRDGGPWGDWKGLLQWLCKWLRARSEYLRCGPLERWESCRFRRLREEGGMGEERSEEHSSLEIYLPLSLHSFSLPFLDWVHSLSFYLEKWVSLILFFQVCSSPLSGTEGSELCIGADSSFSCESPVYPGVDLELFGRGREDSKNTQNHRAWSNQLANLRGSERNWRILRSSENAGDQFLTEISLAGGGLLGFEGQSENGFRVRFLAISHLSLLSTSISYAVGKSETTLEMATSRQDRERARCNAMVPNDLQGPIARGNG